MVQTKILLNKLSNEELLEAAYQATSLRFKKVKVEAQTFYNSSKEKIVGLCARFVLNQKEYTDYYFDIQDNGFASFKYFYIGDRSDVPFNFARLTKYLETKQAIEYEYVD